MLRQAVIDGLEFARTGSSLKGTWPVAGFSRLRDVLRTPEGTLQYELLGVPQEQGRPALRLRISGSLQLVCQRCLGALAFALRIDALLRLAATQAEADAEPLETEGPEWIVAGREMPVHNLVEDELLLAIPFVPRHERCTTEGQVAGEENSPFASLRGLVGGTRH